MGKDYYAILGLERSATKSQIKKAYYKLARKFHPDKTKEADKEAAEKKFKEISEAYAVLSDEEKKKKYDQFGEAGLGGSGGGPSGGPAGGFHFSGTDAEELFSRMFGGAGGNPFGGSAGGSPFGGSAGGNPFGGMFGGFGGSAGGFGGGPPRRRKGANQEHVLNFSLEELYKGRRKTLNITRNITTAAGESRTEKKEAVIDVKPGWKAGTKVTFEGWGNESPTQAPGDIIFVIGEKPHEIFKRDGDDLIATIPVDLKTALGGGTVSFKHIDGEMLNLRMRGITQSGDERRVTGKGWFSRKKQSFGDLIIRFSVKLPTHLSPEKVSKIVSLLA